MHSITEFEQARQTAEGIRLFLERMAGAEHALQLAIEAQQFLRGFEDLRQALQEEQAGLQLARNELEQDLADLTARKQEIFDDLMAEGTKALHADQARLKDAIATLEHERLYQVEEFQRQAREYSERIASFVAEEDRLAKLCHKHRTQLGRVKAEVLRVLQDEEDV